MLQQQIASANKGIYEAAQARPECAGMGTTIVASVFCGNRVSIGHIGDSRCYRLRGEKFEQLTRDHSLLQEQIDSGVLTPEQARYSLNKNLVTRALGIEAIVPTDISEYRIEANDIYLLCSDGLTDMVDPEVIHTIVDEKRSDLAVAAAELIDLANQNGGRDNISVILIRVPPEFLPTTGWAQRRTSSRGSLNTRASRRLASGPSVDPVSASSMGRCARQSLSFPNCSTTARSLSAVRRVESARAARPRRSGRGSPRSITRRIVRARGKSSPETKPGSERSASTAPRRTCSSGERQPARNPSIPAGAGRASSSRTSVKSAKRDMVTPEYKRRRRSRGLPPFRARPKASRTLLRPSATPR